MNQFNSKHNLINVIHFSEDEQKQFLMKLYDLLKKQVKSYNGIDSTSIPIEKASDILNSLMYTILLVADKENIVIEELLKKDFNVMVKQGKCILESKKKSVYNLWKEMCNNAPQIENVYYVSTIKNIGQFFKYYDMYYGAHQIPCSIDYPLLSPISEELKGISYIEEYIKRLTIENKFINSFNSEIVLDLLNKIFDNYKEEYVNLCEVVLIQALARILLDYDISLLNISSADIIKLTNYFKGKTKEEILVDIMKKSELIFNKIYIEDSHIDYFKDVLNVLTTRIALAVESECLSNVFLLNKNIKK